MKYIENIKSVADLNPDYLGFIFYEHSQRNFKGVIPSLPKSIKKTGVFVNEKVSRKLISMTAKTAFLKPSFIATIICIWTSIGALTPW